MAAEQHVSLRLYVLRVPQTRKGVVDDLDESVLTTDLFRLTGVKAHESTNGRICLDVSPLTGIGKTRHAEDEGTQQRRDSEHENNAAKDEKMVSESEESNGAGNDERVQQNVDNGFHFHLADVRDVKVVFLGEEENGPSTSGMSSNP